MRRSTVRWTKKYPLDRWQRPRERARSPWGANRRRTTPRSRRGGSNGHAGSHRPTPDELDRDERREARVGHLASIDRPHPAERPGPDEGVRPSERTLVADLGDPGIFAGVSRALRAAAK